MKHYHLLPIENLEKIQQAVFKILPAEILQATTIVRLREYDQQLYDMPVLDRALADVGLKNCIVNFQLHVTEPNITIPIHCDRGFTYSFNIPITDCKDTFVSWFSTDTEPRVVTVRDDPKGLTYSRYDSDKCTLIERVEINSPYVINTQIPHCVENKSGQTRLMLLCRVYPEVQLSYME
jgi:hypothetical protein